MVTGDHPITAKAIARCVGIISEGTKYTCTVCTRTCTCTCNCSPKSCTCTYCIHIYCSTTHAPKHTCDTLALCIHTLTYTCMWLLSVISWTHGGGVEPTIKETAWMINQIYRMQHFLDYFTCLTCICNKTCQKERETHRKSHHPLEHHAFHCMCRTHVFGPTMKYRFEKDHINNHLSLGVGDDKCDISLTRGVISHLSHTFICI